MLQRCVTVRAASQENLASRLFILLMLKVAIFIARYEVRAR